jgi:hypothetical protein
LLRTRRQAAAASAQTAKRGQQEVADDQDDHAADPEPARDQGEQAAERIPAATAEAHAAAAGRILEIAALALVTEPHRVLLLLGRNALAAQRLQFGTAPARSAAKEIREWYFRARWRW